jgi:hypothetical protein
MCRSIRKESTRIGPPSCRSCLPVDFFLVVDDSFCSLPSPPHASATFPFCPLGAYHECKQTVRSVRSAGERERERERERGTERRSRVAGCETRVVGNKSAVHSWPLITDRVQAYAYARAASRLFRSVKFRGCRIAWEEKVGEMTDRKAVGVGCSRVRNRSLLSIFRVNRDDAIRCDEMMLGRYFPLTI